jgi:hypothetical protein
MPSISCLFAPYAWPHRVSTALPIPSCNKTKTYLAKVEENSPLDIERKNKKCKERQTDGGLCMKFFFGLKASPKQNQKHYFQISLLKLKRVKRKGINKRERRKEKKRE